MKTFKRPRNIVFPLWVTLMLFLGSLPSYAQPGLRANPDWYTTPIETPILLDIQANDTNSRGLALQYSIGNAVDANTRQPCGTLTNQGDGSVLYLPDTGYEGRCEFNYTVTDGIDQATGMVFIEVGAGSHPGMSKAWVSSSAKLHADVQNSPAMDLNSYHLLWAPDGTTTGCDEACNEDLLWDQVNAFLATENGKPVIVSSDGAGDVKRALIAGIQQRIATYPKGTRHYEHFDEAFNNAAALDGYIDQSYVWEQGTLNRLDQLGNVADTLTPGKQVSISGNTILWDNQPVTLMGFSVYGMLSTTRHNLEVYLDKLQENGVNFTREWCFEQWTGQAVEVGLEGFDSTGKPGYLTALSPFAGERPHNLHPPVSFNELYRFDRWNEAFFQRLAQFASMAWDRGIIVQISLFDRAGLRDNQRRGHWKHSPFNHENNQSDTLLSITPGTNYPMTFTGRDGTEIGAINSAFVRKVVETLRPYGNVIFEVMNEPNADFPAAGEVLPWHEWVSQIIQTTYGGGEPDPLQTTAPDSVTVPLGNTASFTTTPSGGSGTYTVRWYMGPSDTGPWTFIDPNTPGITGNNKETLTIATDLATNPEGWYRALVRDAADPDDKVWSAAAQLTVDGEAITVDGPNHVQIDPGDTGVFQIVPGGGSGEYTIRWYFRQTEADTWAILLDADPGISGAKTTALSVDTSIANTTQGFYRAIVRDKNNPDNLKWSQIGQLTFNQLPLAVTDALPAAATVTAGGAQAFTITASGGSNPYQYQWQFQAVGSSTWQAVTAGRFSGTQTASLVLSGAQFADTGLYRCQVTDAAQTQVNSVPASLAVQSAFGDLVAIDLGAQNQELGIVLDVGPPNGYTLPVMAGPSGDIRDSRRNNNDGSQGDNYRFFFDVDGQWPAYSSPNLTITVFYLDKTSGKMELHYNAATDNAKIHPNKIQCTNSNTWRTFSWQLTDADFSNGLSHGSEFRIHHNFLDAADMFLDGAQVHTMRVDGPFPTDPSAPAGSNLTLWVNSPTSGQGGYSYQWYRNDQALSGATSSSYAMTNLDATDAGFYSCQVQDSEGKVVRTKTTMVTITTFDVSQLIDQTVVEHDPVEWAVNAAGGIGPYAYQWQINTQGTWQDLNNDPPRISGALNGTLRLDPSTPDDAGQYRCKVQDQTQTVFSNAAELTILPFNRITIDLGGQASGDGDLFDRLEHTSLPGNGNTLITFQAGNWCRKLAEPKYGTPPGDDEFMYFKVNDQWALDGNRPVVNITMTYLNSADFGELELQYDNGSGIVTHPDKVDLVLTNQWLSHTWSLSDAHFSGNLSHGADFRIRRAPGGNGQMYLDQLVVEGPLAPVAVTAVQPVNPTVGVGQAVTFTVTASNGRPPYLYQWLKNGNPIAGAPNSPSLTLDNLALADAGLYACLVTDDFEDQALATASQLNVIDGSVATIDLGLVNTGSFLTLIEPGGTSVPGAHPNSGNTVGVTGWGHDPGPRECRRNLDPGGNDDGIPDRKMFFRVNDTWAGTKRDFQITLEYLDTGRPGTIRLTYYTVNGAVTLTGQPVTLDGATEPNGVWKTVSWSVTNAKFEIGGMASGTDFYFERFGSGDVNRQLLVIDRVTVE